MWCAASALHTNHCARMRRCMHMWLTTSAQEQDEQLVSTMVLIIPSYAMPDDGDAAEPGNAQWAHRDSALPAGPGRRRQLPGPGAPAKYFMQPGRCVQGAPSGVRLMLSLMQLRCTFKLTQLEFAKRK